MMRPERVRDQACAWVHCENGTPNPGEPICDTGAGARLVSRHGRNPLAATLLPRRLWLAALPALGLAACASEPAPRPAPVVTAPPPPPAEPPLGAAVARVEITKWQMGFIGQVHWGEGVLTYQGRRHRFRVRGLGAGGAGMARVRATGEVQT